MSEEGSTEIQVSGIPHAEARKKYALEVGQNRQTSFSDRLRGAIDALKRHKALAAGAVAATAIAATGTGDKIANVAGDAMDLATKPIEAILPDTSSEFTTPKEIYNGSVDLNLANELHMRLDPNAAGDIVDKEDLELVTSVYDAEKNENVEKLIDLSNVTGVKVNNPLVVHAQNMDGGANKGKWLILPAEKDGKRFNVFVSLSEQTSPYYTLNGEGFVGIKTQELDGAQAYLPENPGDSLPNGAINDIQPLVPTQE